MKIHTDIDIFEDNHIYDIRDTIISETAKQLIDKVFRDKTTNCYNDTFEEKLYKEVKTILIALVNDDFKKSIKKEIVNEIVKKYIRTKQYKEIKEHFEIDSDKVIKSGLKDIISDIVKSEIKKCFN